MGHLQVFILFAFASTGVHGGTDLYYDLTASYFCGAPDGVTVCHILGVNGQFPGPTIEGTIGDRLHVTLTNAISSATHTSIHWHGLFQNGTPFADGPDMVTQCGV